MLAPISVSTWSLRRRSRPRVVDFANLQPHFCVVGLSKMGNGLVLMVDWSGLMGLGDGFFELLDFELILEEEW